jgi:pimeloyl-ACP methyl ester carboxylesterase
MRRTWCALVAISVVMGGLCLAPAAAQGATDEGPRAIVFVHGFAGSGAQYETQAKRFAGNGYPIDRVAVHEYDSLFTTETRDDVYARLDARIEALIAETGWDQVDLIGHSLGTALMIQYLNSSPERAARVAHYVNLDGATAPAEPGGVETLAVWGQGELSREITGAKNVYFPEQTHTEVVTSAESFSVVHEFLTGSAPVTTDVEAQPGTVSLAGRAVYFPQNAGAEGGRLKVYEVDPATGKRLSRQWLYTKLLDETGSFGPFDADGAASYEFELVRPNRPEARIAHFYPQPFLRSDHLIRLLTSPEGAGIGALIDRDPDTSALNVIRYREWWGDQGADNDVLEIDGTNVINPDTAPISGRKIAMFAFDDASDGVGDGTQPIDRLASLPFIGAVDLALRAVAPPDDVIEVVSIPRGEGGHVDAVHVPNWNSFRHFSTVLLHDFVNAAA